jgi:hypothetical protein
MLSEELLARYVLDRLAPEAVCELALAALERGCEQPPVVLLAGLQAPTRADVDPLLDALGCPRLGSEEAMKILVDAEAAKIARGTTDPLAAAETIWSLFGYGEQGEDRPELWKQIEPFARACLERDADDYDRAGDDFADIRAAADALLAGGGLT